jgi:hypothetical protein
VNFIRLLSHIAFRLNEQARPLFVELLPSSIAEAIQAPSGEEEHLEEWEQVLLAAFDNPVEREDVSAGDGEDVGDAEETPADEASPSQGGPALFALLLAGAPVPARAALLLFNLPLHLQGPVLHRLLTLSPLSCARGIADAEREFVDWVRREQIDREHWGLESAREILRAANLPRQVRRLLLAVAEIDRESALLLQHHLYDFADLLQLSDRDLQVLLAKESNENLAQAFLDLPEAVSKRFRRHVSARRRTMIAEETARYALISPIEIEAAQRAVLSTACYLYNTRRITTYFGSLEDREEGEVDDLTYFGSLEDREQGEVDDLVEQEGEEDEKQAEGGKNETIGKADTSAVSLQKKIMLAMGVIAALILWYVVLFSGDRVETTDRSRDEKSKYSSGGVRGAAVVLSEGGRSGEEESIRAGNSPEILSEGQYFDTESGVQAVVDVVGQAQLEVEELSHIEHLGSEGGETGHVLALRVGRLRATVVDEDFELRTPVVRIQAPIGAKYTTRVVLDATTTIRVESRWVEVKSRRDPALKWHLEHGDGGVFSSNGDVSIKRKGE